MFAQSSGEFESEALWAFHIRSSVPKHEPPTATTTTTLNIVQRLGGRRSRRYVTFLAWRMRLSGGPSAKAFVAGFALLCGLQVLALLSSLQLSTRVERSADESVTLDGAIE
jgi:hypothetical protein